MRAIGRSAKSFRRRRREPTTKATATITILIYMRQHTRELHNAIPYQLNSWTHLFDTIIPSLSLSLGPAIILPYYYASIARGFALFALCVCSVRSVRRILFRTYKSVSSIRAHSTHTHTHRCYKSAHTTLL